MGLAKEQEDELKHLFQSGEAPCQAGEKVGAPEIKRVFDSSNVLQSGAKLKNFCALCRRRADVFLAEQAAAGARSAGGAGAAGTGAGTGESVSHSSLAFSNCFRFVTHAHARHCSSFLLLQPPTTTQRQLERRDTKLPTDLRIAKTTIQSSSSSHPPTV